MKSNSIEIVLLPGAILFWIVVLPVASLFFAIAVAWEKTEALMRGSNWAPESSA
jgi:hypothetical protein